MWRESRPALGSSRCPLSGPPLGSRHNLKIYSFQKALETLLLTCLASIVSGEMLKIFHYAEHTKNCEYRCILHLPISSYLKVMRPYLKVSPVQLVGESIVHLSWTAGFPARCCGRICAAAARSRRSDAFATISALGLA